MIYFYCTSWQFFHIIVKWRISPTTEQIMFTFSILLFHFYSHIPCGMWLSYIWSIKITKIISTHTSRVGCDRYTDWSEILVINFYSHIPCGMWPQWQYSTAIWQKFLLTHPVWDVTQSQLNTRRGGTISTHTSRVGCDIGKINPDLLPDISTHTSRVGCDVIRRKLALFSLYFYSHIPCGMWRWVGVMTHTAGNFYSHIPCGMWQSGRLHRARYLKFLLTHPVWDVTYPPNILKIFCFYFYSHIPCGMWPIAI